MYGGMCTGAWATGIMSLANTAPSFNIKLGPGFIMNESLIQRARNVNVIQFLDSDCEYLMFIDADIGFEARQVLELVLAHKLTGQRLIGGNYPQKTIVWESALRAASHGVKPQFLGHCAGRHVVQPFSKTENSARLHDLYPVNYLGTGFMLIHRSLIEDMKTICEPFKANNAPPDFKTLRDFWLFFDCKLDANKIYLSEDYFFCANAIKLGVVPQMAMWINLAHYGTYPFEGCFMCTQGAYPHAKAIMTPEGYENYRKTPKDTL